MHPVLNIAISAARQAADVLLRYVERLDRIDVYSKGPNNFYSEVDLKAEEVIIKALSKAYPDDGFIAEESGVHNPDAEHIWLIDPMDGTSNYLHGYPYFCVSLALKINDKIECGVIFDPIHQECFSAARGCGARLNDRRLRVSPKVTELKDALIGTTVSYPKPASTPRDTRFYQIAEQASGIRKTGAAALDLAYVAAGRLDGFIGVNLQSWDIAAGAIIIQEAGGFVSDLDGQDQYLKQGHVLAGNPRIFKQMQQILTTTSEG